jgi:phospholipid/cholesterol/gamma-HCH transport system substrate-binding protein
MPVIKQAPTLPRLAAIVLFTFSCFVVLTYMWLTFGGPVPMQPQGYRFNAVFTEAPLLVQEADVRIAGLNVGKVKKISRAPNGGVMTEMEIDERYAPVQENARVTLRPKSLLGQIYVELTPGSRGAPPLDDGETLDDAQVQESVEIDELLTLFDEDTRENLRGWMRELADAIDKGRGQDFNQALGHLPQFVASGSDVLRVLDEEEPALRRLVRNSGVTLGALNERRNQFRDLIVNADRFFDTVASRNERLSEVIEILPTFLDETRATVARLEEFSIDTRPLVRDLQPVATDLRPTLRNVGRLAPDLEHLFRNLDPLIDEAPRTLPRAAAFLRGVVPVWENLHPYLQELNPIISFLNYYQEQVSDFIMNGSGSFSGTLPPVNDQSGPRHYLRQMSITNTRSLAFSSVRQSFDRGNAYPAPNYLRRANAFGIQEAWDCKPTGPKPEATAGEPPCFIAPGSLWDGNKYPQLESGEDRLVPPPEGTEGRTPARAPSP